MMRSGMRRITVIIPIAAAGGVLLAGCGPAKPSSTAAGAGPAAVSTASNASVAGPVGAGNAGSLNACGLITEQDASTAMGEAAGAGKAGGGPALSECIFGDSALVVGMKKDGKALYDKSYADARSKGATDLPGIGDGAFEGGTDQQCTLLLLKGTTIVSILLAAPGAQSAAVTLAKIAASKL
jgi:hypothetical protein